jgi:hypothetical protein
MAETFYPFVGDGSPQADDADLAAPATSARIAVYDSMAMVPRVVSVEPADIRTFLDEITKNVFELAQQQGGDWSFMVIRELVENFIHASFQEVSISILDKGQTLVFSDQGPGIPNKQAALKPSFSSATRPMKRYIRGVGSGLPIVEEQLKLRNGSITIDDNLGHGTIVTVSLLPVHEEAGQPAGAQPPTGQAAPRVVPAPAAAPAAVPAAATQQPSYQATYPQAAWPYAPQPAGFGYPQPYPQQPPAGWPAWQQPQGYPQQPVAAQAPASAPAWPYAPQPWQQAAQPGATATPATPNTYAYQQVPAPAAPVQPVSAGFSALDAHAPLTPQQRSILTLFSTHEKVGPSELQESLQLAPATGSRRLNEIARAGYVVKSGQKYVLTGEGERMLALLSNSEA